MVGVRAQAGNTRPFRSPCHGTFVQLNLHLAMCFLHVPNASRALHQLTHRHFNSDRKRQELQAKLAATPDAYRAPSTDADAKILSLSLSQVVAACAGKDALAPSDILEAYGKRCLRAHEATNCLADVFFTEAEQHLPPSPALAADFPLLGVPVSLKECIDVAGHDTTCGFSARAFHPATHSAPLVRLLRDAGALAYAKTTLPTGFLSFELSSDLFGRTTNPYNPAFSPGASTGGGGALLAWQGSMVEVGTDLGGSARYPAAHCGLYTVKGSHGRLPSAGCRECMPGLEAVPSITAPLARTLDDLEEFWRRVVAMRPWEYDHTVRCAALLNLLLRGVGLACMAGHEKDVARSCFWSPCQCVPLPWRPVDYLASGKKLKFGLLMDDGERPAGSGTG